MVILAQHWAEAYAGANEGVLVEVNGGGSGTGFTALINGVTDIANASRPIKESEVRALTERRSVEPIETRVALDAIAIYVHEDNPVETLSLAQLARLYRGQVSNWSEVGGPDRPVTLYGRENSSGTYAYFKEHVLDERDFAVETQSLPGTAGVIQAVSVDPGGIGYGGIGYASGVRIVPLRVEDGTAIEPTLDNARDGTYPLARFLFMYTAGEPSGTAAALHRVGPVPGRPAPRRRGRLLPARGGRLGPRGPRSGLGSSGRAALRAVGGHPAAARRRLPHPAPASHRGDGDHEPGLRGHRGGHP